MKDAFEKEIGLRDIVLFSTKGGAGTNYTYGKIVKLHPSKSRRENSLYTPPDRVEIQVLKTTQSYPFSKNPLVYASNVVKQPLDR